MTPSLLRVGETWHDYLSAVTRVEVDGLNEVTMRALSDARRAHQAALDESYFETLKAGHAPVEARAVARAAKGRA